MKNEFKGTKGVVNLVTEHHNSKVFIETGYVTVAVLQFGDYKHTANENETTANAELICEAFNVVNETGKTPRQLADINKELLTAIQKVKDYVSENKLNVTFPDLWFVADKYKTTE